LCGASSGGAQHSTNGGVVGVARDRAHRVENASTVDVAALLDDLKRVVDDQRVDDAQVGFAQRANLEVRVLR